MLPQLYHLVFAVASLLVKHVVCQNNTNARHLWTPHSSLAAMWGSAVASGPPLPEKGFQP